MGIRLDLSNSRGPLQLRYHGGPTNFVRHASTYTSGDADDETALELQHITRTANTLFRAKRLLQLAQVIDDGLSMYPWHPPLWFWKLRSKEGDSAGAIEVWENMNRLGIEKGPEHYDTMTSILLRGDGRSYVINLFDETLNQDFVASNKFYAAVFYVCADNSTLLFNTAVRIWADISKKPHLAHVLEDEYVKLRYQDILARIGKHESARALPGVSNETSKAIRTQEQHAHKQTKVTDDFQPEGQANESIHLDQATPVSSTPTTSGSTGDLNMPRSTPEKIPDDLEESRAMLPHSTTQMSVLLHKELERFFHSGTGGQAHHKAVTRARDLLSNHVCAEQSYAYVVRSAALLGQPDILTDILQDAVETGLKPGISIYVSNLLDISAVFTNVVQHPIIRAYFIAGRPEDALNLVQRMDMSNVPYDHRTFVLILEGLFSNGRADDALDYFVKLFGEESDMALIPGKDDVLACFNTAIEALCNPNVNRFSDAQECKTQRRNK